MKRKRKSTGEAIVFYEIWNERQHICENCKIYLGNDARTWFFSHIKSKGKYPELRLEKNNIQQEHKHNSCSNHFCIFHS